MKNPVAQLLQSQRIEHIDYELLQSLPASEQREKILAADIGITGVDYAIAETGTLVVASRPGQERVASLLPPVHVAVVAQEQILPDLFDVFALLNPPDLPSNLALITGPSKTGDIELQLTTGVHGPGQWRVIIVK